MTNEEVLAKAVKLYAWKHKTGGWYIHGYKCPFCYKHYASLRVEFYSHVKKCKGPKLKKSLED